MDNTPHIVHVNNDHKDATRGFAKIELLIAVFLVGCAGIMMASYISDVHRAERDALRLQDMTALARALDSAVLISTTPDTPIPGCEHGGMVRDCAGVTDLDFTQYVDPRGDTLPPCVRSARIPCQYTLTADNTMPTLSRYALCFGMEGSDLVPTGIYHITQGGQVGSGCMQ